MIDIVNSSISVVTYNILAQAYVFADRYPRSRAEDLAAAPRRARLLDHLASFDADVYCIQEAEPDSFAAIRERLGSGYWSMLELRAGKPDGCARTARSSVARVEKSEVIHYRAHDRDGDQVAVIAHLATPRPLAIACTHLRWQAEGTRLEEHIGLAQMRELLEVRERTASSWILCGDMNALSESVVIRAAIDRGLELACRASRPWDTVNINGKRRKLDYLLYTPATLAPKPRPLPALDRDTPMPSAIHPSDHLAVCIDFSWI